MLTDETRKKTLGQWDSGTVAKARTSVRAKQATVNLLLLLMRGLVQQNSSKKTVGQWDSGTVGM